MAGTRIQICLDALYRLDALIYGIRKHQIIAQRQTPQKYGDHGYSLERISEDLKIQKMIYSQVLFQILEEQSVAAIQGEDADMLERKMRNRLKPLFRSFVSTAELLGRQIGKIAEALRINDRVRVDVLHVVMAGDPRNEPASELELITSLRNEQSGSVELTPPPFDLPRSEERFRESLEADIKSTTDLSHFKEMYKRVLKTVIRDQEFPELIKGFELLNKRISTIWERTSPNRSTHGNKRLKELPRIRSDLSILARVIGGQRMFSCSCRENHRGLLLVEDLLSETDCDRCPTFQLMFHNIMPKKSKLNLDFLKRTTWKLAKATASVLLESPNELPVKEKNGLGSAIERKVRIVLPHLKSQAMANLSRLPFFEDICSDICRWDKERNLSNAALPPEGWLGDKAEQVKLRFESPILSQWSSPAPFNEYWLETNPKVSVDEKLTLALRIASSLLSLGGSSWLHSQWTSADFWACQRITGQVSTVDIYVPMTHESNGSTDTSDFLDCARSIMDPSLLSLGFFLVELAVGEPWSKIRQRYIPESSTTFMHISAEDWAAMGSFLEDALNDSIPFSERPLHDEGPMFIDAVQRCVKGDFEGKRASLEDASFRQAVYDRVICGLRDAIEDRKFDLEWSPSRNIPNMRLFDDKNVRQGSETLATKWFNKYNEAARFFEESKTTIGSERRVKVAILDSGIDQSNSMITKEWQRIRFKSFLKDNEVVDDTHGHGTHIAGLIVRVAKNVDLHVFRVTKDNEFGEDNIESIANALNQAIKDDVDIISLSFGFPYQTQAVHKIQTAIKEAYAKGIIIFAAAGNSGANERIAYPADQEEVIWIGSSDGLGNRSEFTPRPKASGSKYRFITVGEGVKSAWPKKIGGRQFQSRSGTSYATPIAAGIAAAVLDFMRFKLWNDNPDSEEWFLLGKKIKSKKGMQTILHKMADKTTDGYDYIMPWKLFDSYSETRSDSIAGILEELLKKV